MGTPKKQVHVIAKMIAREGAADQLREVLTPMLEPTRRYKGCLRFELLQNHFNPCEFTFVEVWESRKALHTHLTAGYLQDVASKLQNILEHPPQITMHQHIES